VLADGLDGTRTVTGDLTLRGVTREVTFDVVVRRTGATFAVNGAIDVHFDDFEIPDASGGPPRWGATASSSCSSSSPVDEICAPAAPPGGRDASQILRAHRRT